MQIFKRSQQEQIIDSLADLRRSAIMATECLNQIPDGEDRADARSSATKAQGELFKALFDTAVTDIETALTELGALFKLANIGKTYRPRKPWHLAALEDAYRRLLPRPDVDGAALSIKRRELENELP